jgi:hypothetical protein
MCGSVTLLLHRQAYGTFLRRVVEQIEFRGVGGHVIVDERRQCTSIIWQHALRPIGLDQEFDLAMALAARR